jgi:hypothetical protein
MSEATPTGNSIGNINQDWEEYDPQTAEQEQEAFDTGEFYKPEEGITCHRILPGVKGGPKSPFMITFEHFVKVAGLKNGITIRCPRMLAKLPCRVCSRAADLRATGNVADAEVARDMAALIRGKVEAVIVDGKKKNQLNPLRDLKVRRWGLGKTIHEKLRQILDSSGDFSHPMSGFDLYLTATSRKGTDFFDYSVVPARANTRLAPTDGELSVILGMRHDLRALAIPHSDEEIANLLTGRREGRALERGRRTAGDDMVTPVHEVGVGPAREADAVMSSADDSLPF